MRRGTIVSVVLLTACGSPRPTETLRDWQVQPPRSVCVATIRTSHGARVEHHDAAGQPVFGTTATASEWLHWTDARLVAADTYIEHPATDTGCEVVGGCPQPAERIVIHTRYAYEGSRLVDVTSEERAYIEHGGEWQPSAAPQRSTVAYRYEGGHLVAAGAARFAYEGEHVVRRTASDGITTYEWQGDRLTTARTPAGTRTFTYDAAGRLMREDGPREIHEWSYDDAGRLATALVSAAGGTALSTRGSTFTYDAAGRLAEAVAGDARETRAYEGTCANALAVPGPPVALDRTQATPCIRTPAGLVDTCGYER